MFRTKQSERRKARIDQARRARRLRAQSRLGTGSLQFEQLERREMMAVVLPGGIGTIPTALTSLIPAVVRTEIDGVLAAGDTSAAIYQAFPGEVNTLTVSTSAFDLFVFIDDNSQVPLFRIPPVLNKAVLDAVTVDAGVSFGMGLGADLAIYASGDIGAGYEVTPVTGQIVAGFELAGALSLAFDGAAGLTISLPLTEMLGGVPDVGAIVPNPGGVGGILDAFGLGALLAPLEPLLALLSSASDPMSDSITIPSFTIPPIVPPSILDFSVLESNPALSTLSTFIPGLGSFDDADFANPFASGFTIPSFDIPAGGVVGDIVSTIPGLDVLVGLASFFVASLADQLMVTADLGDMDDFADLNGVTIPTKVLGGTGNDFVIGSSDDDEFIGGTDNDVFELNDQSDGDTDVFNGGAGDDTLLIPGSDTADVIHLYADAAGNLVLYERYDTFGNLAAKTFLTLTDVEEIQILGEEGGQSLGSLGSDSLIIHGKLNYKNGVSFFGGDESDAIVFISEVCDVSDPSDCTAVTSDLEIEVPQLADDTVGSFYINTFGYFFADVEDSITLDAQGAKSTIVFEGGDDSNTIRFSGTDPGGAVFNNSGQTGIELVEFGDDSEVTIDGLSGNDDIVIALNGVTEFGTIHVFGGGPFGKDSLLIEGFDTDDEFDWTPDPADIQAGQIEIAEDGVAGDVDVHYSQIGAIGFVGSAGEDRLDVNEPAAGADDTVLFSPRPANAGSITLSSVVVDELLTFPPVDFRGIEIRRFVTGTGEDELVVFSDDLTGVNQFVDIIGATGTSADPTTIDYGRLNDEVTEFIHDTTDDDALILQLSSAHDFVYVEPGEGLFISVDMGLGENTLEYEAADDAEVLFDLDNEVISQAGYGDVVFTGTHVLIDANDNELTAMHDNIQDVLTLEILDDEGGIFSLNNPFAPTVEFFDSVQLNLEGDGALNVKGSNFPDAIGLTQTVANAVEILQRVVQGVFSLNKFDAANPSMAYVPVHAEGYRKVIVDGGKDDDLFRVSVAQALDGNAGNLLSYVFAGNTGKDQLIIVDDGVGDTILRREEVDELSGYLKVGGLAPVHYESLETVAITPFDPVSGGTGSDLKGREVVLESDPLEPNDNRFAAHGFDTLDGVNRTPNIGDPGLTDPFGAGTTILGDEDWFRYEAIETGTYRFALIFTLVGDPADNHELTNGRPGLPDSGELDLIIYDALGREIVDADDLPTISLPGIFGDLNVLGSPLGTTVNAVNGSLAGRQQGPTGKIVDVGIEQGTTVYARVKGHTPQAVNGYDLIVLSPQQIADGAIPDLLNDGIISPTALNFDDVSDPPGGGLRINKVEINSFNPPDHYGADPMNPTVGTRAPRKIFPPATVTDPTFQVESITIFLEDFPPRAPGFLYKAINETNALQPGNYILEGAHSGPITIDRIEVVNDPVTLGQTAKGRVTLHFNYPLPDDRYSLTIRDTLIDPATQPLDGETNSLAPVQESEFKSGNGVPGGDFVGNFSVDTRVEIGTFFAGSFWIDLNQDGTFDADNPDPTNRDVVYQFGTNDGLTDKPVIGDWDGDGFDEIGLYARDKNTGVYRFHLDKNSNGLFDPGTTANDDFPAFAFLPNGTVSANPIAADWNNDGFDDVGLLNSFNWILDLNGDKLLSSGETIPTNFEGLPFVGNWDGTFRTFPNGTTGPNMRLGTYNTSQETFYFDMNGDRRFDESLGDLKIKYFVPGIERPLVGDFDADFDTNIGLMITNVQSITPGLVTQWLLDLGGPRKNPLLDLTDTLDGRDDYDPTGSPGDGKFQPAPTGFPGQPLTYQDIFYEVGDARYLPFSGNFDLPATRIANTAAPPLPVPSGPNVFHNYLKPADVDTSGTVTTADANSVYSFLIANGTRPVSAVTYAGQKLDVNNDQFISPQDFIAVQQVLSGGSPEDGYDLAPLAATAIGMYTNGLLPEDVNFDGLIGAVDALIIANEINDFGGNKPAMEVRFAGHFVDPSGDDLISAMDFLYVANYLANRAPAAAGEGESIGGPRELHASVVFESVVEIDGKNESEGNEVGAYPTDRTQNSQALCAATAAATTRDIAITGLAPAATSTSNRLAPRGGSSATAPSLPTAAGRGRAIDTLLQAIESRSKSLASPPADKTVDVELDAILSDIAADVGDHWQSSGSETR